MPLAYLSMFGIEHMQSLLVVIVLCSGLSFDGRTQMLRIRCLSVQTNHSPEQTQHMLLAYLSMFGIEHMQRRLFKKIPNSTICGRLFGESVID